MKKGRSSGAKDTEKRKERKISNDHREKIRSTLSKKNNEKKEAKKREEKEKKERNMARFLAALHGGNHASNSDAGAEVSDTATDNVEVTDAATDNVDDDSEDNSCKNDAALSESILAEELIPPDHDFELEEEPVNERDDECNKTAREIESQTCPVEGAMQEFLSKIQNRLRSEVRTERSSDGSCRKWLLDHLKKHN